MLLLLLECSEEHRGILRTIQLVYYPWINVITVTAVILVICKLLWLSCVRCCWSEHWELISSCWACRDIPNKWVLSWWSVWRILLQLLLRVKGTCVIFELIRFYSHWWFRSWVSLLSIALWRVIRSHDTS